MRLLGARHPAGKERILDQRNPQQIRLIEKRTAKFDGHDTNHGERAHVEINRASDDVWIASELTAPHTLAKNDDRRSATLAIARKQDATEQGLSAKDAEEVEGH